MCQRPNKRSLGTPAWMLGVSVVCGHLAVVLRTDGLPIHFGKQLLRRLQH